VESGEAWIARVRRLVRLVRLDEENDKRRWEGGREVRSMIEIEKDLQGSEWDCQAGRWEIGRASGVHGDGRDVRGTWGIRGIRGGWKSGGGRGRESLGESRRDRDRVDSEEE